jgi:hypothetical protein
MQRGFAHLLLILEIVLVLGVGVVALLFLYTKPSASITQVTNPTVLADAPKENLKSKSTILEYQDNLLIFKYDSAKFEVKQDSEDELFKRQNGNARKNFVGNVGYQPTAVLSALALISKGESNLDVSPFAIWVFENPDNLDASGWFGKYWYYPFNWGMYEWADRAKISPKEEATVAGQMVNYGVIAYQQGSPKYYLISKNAKMYLVRVTGEGEKVLESLKL